MTDEKVVQLAEKHRIAGSDGALAAIREAYDVGRRDGLEEAAKIAFGRGDKYQKQLDNCGSSHELEYDDCDLTSMQANEAWAIAATIRQLTDAPSISSSANSVEGKKE